MRIILVKPPFHPANLAPMWGDPLELEYVAAAVPDHDVQILDMRIDRRLLARLERFRPELVGVTANTCDVPMAMETLRAVRKFDPRIVTAVGGAHATFLPSDFLDPAVDAIFLGLADSTFRDFVQRLDAGQDLAGVPNLALVRNGRLELTEHREAEVDLDRLPFPARHLLDRYRGKYRDLTGLRTAQVMTCRGCPFRCTFCSCWKVLDSRYYVRSPESIVDELAALGEEIDSVQFADDNTLHDVARAHRLADLIRQRGIRKKLSMYARADLISRHPALIESLKDAGLAHLTVGFEAFRQESLQRLNKSSSLEANRAAIEVLRKNGIGNAAHFIVDPDFSREDFRALFRHVCDHDLFQPTYTILTPLPGTDLYQSERERLVIRNYAYFDLAHAVLPTRLSRKDFYRQFMRLYIRTYSFGRYFRSLMDDMRSRLRKELPLGRVDRLSFLALCVVHLVAQPLKFKVGRIHRTEPLIRSA